MILPNNSIKRISLDDLEVKKVFETVYASEITPSKAFKIQCVFSKTTLIKHNGTCYYDICCLNSKLPLKNKGYIKSECFLRLPQMAFNYALNCYEQKDKIKSLWEVPVRLEMIKLNKNQYKIVNIIKKLDDGDIDV
jgi:hypothetical protein